ncbi:nitroreductase family protein [Corynebacterium sp. HS2168-gen11]|uniref:nitroreductase family protein n=1 Tax=Corynebacterium sp. HS2168-gen11 TaxID=2974027 RepID=UPI00216B2A30|nr:nitroreductase family protein [Corynebacterium sp. HS2168-gen11]
MSEFLNLLRNRSSVRAFNSKEIPQATIDEILSLMTTTATSNYRQQVSVIRVTDPAKKAQIAEIGKQEFQAVAPEMFIFVADNFRNLSLLEKLGKDVAGRSSDVDSFFQAFTDAVLMAQQTSNIVESMGMGSVFLGSILNDAQALIEILELPEHTMPVVGLLFGFYDDKPETKPKMGPEVRVFENTYSCDAEVVAKLDAFNDVTDAYYTQRGMVDFNFFNHLAQAFDQQTPKRNELLNVARKNGYRL